jgi:TIR domain
MSTQRKPRVFLCHSSGDKPAVRALCDRLEAWGCDAWLDERKLQGGQNWDLEIRRAVKASDIVLVCLSQTSTTRAGYVQKELRLALDVAQEQPEGTIFLIPVKLEDCGIPDRLGHLQWIDLQSSDGHTRLFASITMRALTLGCTLSADDLERRGLGEPDLGSRWNQRTAHFAREKAYLATFFGSALLQRCRQLAEEGRHVNLVLDAGTTVAALFSLIASARTSQLGDCSPSLVTNNLVGVQEFMAQSRLFGTDRPFLQCHLLSGSVMPRYKSALGDTTDDALRHYFESHHGDTFIGITAAPWVLLRDASAAPVPISRAAGSKSFKETLIECCDEVYVVSPLGKLWFASLAEINASLVKGDDRLYEEPRIPQPKSSSIYLVTTARKQHRVLGRFSVEVCHHLAHSPVASADDIKLPGHVVMNYDDLPSTVDSQINVEFPELHDPELLRKFFLVETPKR